MSGILITVKTKKAAMRSWRKMFCLCCGLLAVLSVLALLLIPDLREGAKLLCNRLFAASESINPYLYRYFTAAEGASETPALVFAALLLLSLILLALVWRNPVYTLFCMAVFCLGQIYFGLALPVWANVLIGGILSWTLLRWDGNARTAVSYAVVFLLTALLTWLIYPGVDPLVEASSETARDYLSGAAMQMSGIRTDAAEDPVMARHVNSRTLLTGEEAAETDQTFRLVTVEEEQISMPDVSGPLNLVLIILLCAAAAAALGTAVYKLAVRRKRLAEIRGSFCSENTAESVCAVFRHVIRYLESAGHGSGNLPFRDWPAGLRETMPEDYVSLFENCVPVFEEACYSEHSMARDRLDPVNALLAKTEELFFDRADLKAKFRLKYLECLHE